jgi:hypothetical protein
MNWKTVLLRAAGFGAGFAVCLAILGGILYWYSHRSKPWNNTALKATFAGMSFHTRPQDPAYDITLDFDVENTTSRDYDFNPAGLKILAVTEDGNALSKEFGNYQSGEPTLDGPSFITSHGKVRITLHLSYLCIQTTSLRRRRMIQRRLRRQLVGG